MRCRPWATFQERFTRRGCGGGVATTGGSMIVMGLNPSACAMVFSTFFPNSSPCCRSSIQAAAFQSFGACLCMISTRFAMPKLLAFKTPILKVCKSVPSFASSPSLIHWWYAVTEMPTQLHACWMVIPFWRSPMIPFMTSGVILLGAPIFRPFGPFLFGLRFGVGFFLGRPMLILLGLSVVYKVYRSWLRTDSRKFRNIAGCSSLHIPLEAPSPGPAFLRLRMR